MNRSAAIAPHFSQPRETTGTAVMREDVERYEELKRNLREMEEDNRVAKEASGPACVFDERLLSAAFASL